MSLPTRLVKGDTVVRSLTVRNFTVFEEVDHSGGNEQQASQDTFGRIREPCPKNTGVERDRKPVDRCGRSPDRGTRVTGAVREGRRDRDLSQAASFPWSQAVSGARGAKLSS